MTVHLYFADWGATSAVASKTELGLTNERKIVDGTPILVDGGMRPLEPWCMFLRQYALNVSPKSSQAYARDALRFSRFLDSRGVAIGDVAQSDLVAYRKERRAKGIAESTWARELVVIRALFGYLLEVGLRTTLPWIQVGRRSIVHPRVSAAEMDVRALTHEQWTAFLDVGLGGRLPGGELDCSYRGRSTVRDTTAAELAVTTGMRIQEWRTVLDVEIRADRDSGASFVIERTAKNGRRRTIYVPAATVRTIDLYRASERKRVVREAQGTLRKRLSDLAVVDKTDQGSGRLSYTLHGVRHRHLYPMIPIEHRRLLVELHDDFIEPITLLIGEGGLPPSQRSWHDRFAKANARIESFVGESPVMPRSVTPHDLRHTFAVVLLRSLQQRAIEHERDRPKYGTGTISEHIVFNPLLTLQRLLGHASPSTTMIYLRYVDESHDLVQRAFESWGDGTRDYASYILEKLEGSA
ncbi:MAG: tyrosine-type recombinase/integrase [Rhodococcus sp. (in: high G+C Gram-positive bacteria)]